MAPRPKPRVLHILSDPARTLPQQITFAVLMILALGLLTLQYIRNDWRDDLSNHILSVLAPINASISHISHSFQNGKETLSSWIFIREQLASLEQENSRLRYLENHSNNLEEENRSLRKLLNFPREYASSYVSARVFADTSGVFARSLLVDVGSAQGVEVGHAVLSKNALAGRITSVDKHWSRVILINDANSVIPVISRWQRENALLEGSNSKHLRLSLVPSHHSFSVGQQLTTSGQGFTMPPDIPVAIVESVNDNIILAKPIAEPLKDGHVVIVNYKLPQPLDPSMLSKK